MDTLVKIADPATLKFKRYCWEISTFYAFDVKQIFSIVWTKNV